LADAEEVLGHKIGDVSSADVPKGSKIFADYEKKKLPYDKYDYPVPNFGGDSDVDTTKKNIEDAENTLGHKLKASFKSENEYLLGEDGVEIKRNYFVPNFGEDEDIKASKSNLALMEKSMGTKLEVEDYPKIKRNYFVPNFGYDQDVVDAKKNIAAAEKSQNHVLDIKRDGEGSYNLLQTGADIRLESDPICNSAGCTQYKHPQKDRGYKINYPVPNFGRDHDINTNFNSLDRAEEIVGHHWVW